MAEFPVGITIPAWTEVFVGDAYNVPPVTSDGGATVTLLAKQDPAHINSGNTHAWSDLSLPLEANGNPASFEVRFSLSLGSGPVGISVALTDNDGYCPANLLLTQIGTYLAGASTGEARLTNEVHCGGTLPEAAPQYVAIAPINNEGTVPTTPVPVILGWDHATNTAYVDYGGVRSEYSPAQDWVTDPLYDHSGTTGASQVYRVMLIDEDRGFPGDPYSAFAVQLTGVEVEVFGASSLSVRDMTIEMCGEGPC